MFEVSYVGGSEQRIIMMIPFYDKNDKLFAWFEDNVIYDTTSRYRAFIEDEAVFTYQCVHIGRFASDYFRDRRGDAVAFIEGALKGPLSPTPSIPQIPSIPPLPPIPPIDTLSWSNLTWEEFISG